MFADLIFVPRLNIFPMYAHTHLSTAKLVKIKWYDYLLNLNLDQFNNIGIVF